MCAQNLRNWHKCKCRKLPLLLADADYNVKQETFLKDKKRTLLSSVYKVKDIFRRNDKYPFRIRLGYLLALLEKRYNSNRGIVHLDGSS
jgi:hypothetical protein